MNKKLVFSTLCLAALSLNIKAQDNSSKKLFPKNDSNKHISGYEPRVNYKIAPMVERYLDFTDSLDQVKLKNTGYRIQIASYSGPSARENATKSQSEFLKYYEQTPSYTKWDYPNWAVRVGDFRTKLEALEFHIAIRELYPASFIVTDEIKVKY